MKIQVFVLNYRKSSYGTYETLLVTNEVSVCQVSWENSQKQSCTVVSSEKLGVRLAYGRTEKLFFATEGGGVT